jgi:hypothetical protein
VKFDGPFLRIIRRRRSVLPPVISFDTLGEHSETIMARENMSSKNTILHSVIRIGLATAFLFLVGVLLAAMPGHHPPAMPGSGGQSPAATPKP